MRYRLSVCILAVLTCAILPVLFDSSTASSTTKTVEVVPVSEEAVGSPISTAQRRGRVADRIHNSTYYTIRPDLRRCASPLCGGYFVKRVNHAETRCANGRNAEECYVAEIDWNGQPSVAPGDALLRGEMTERRFQGRGRFGIFRVTESWRAATTNRPDGMLYRVRDLGVRCITHPCLSHRESQLNTAIERNVAGVELPGENSSNESVLQAMTSSAGILVAGTHRRVVGPGGRADTLIARQYYLRADAAVGTNPCRKTGCSGQVCADNDVMTTCEWRSEYECYRTARCERQTNGQCGFTQTPELTACLRRR